MTRRGSLFILSIIVISLSGWGLLPAQTPSAAVTSSTASTDEDDDSAPVQDSDFLVDGVPSAKVIYMEGNVWIRPPGETSFHRLTDDEPIPAMSIIATGFNGILDFATAPGMAVRMVPSTVIRVNLLPQASTTSSSSMPHASQVFLRRGTVFSALGREDGAPIDFQVKTPLGLAGARGTMFSTTASFGQTEVNMLHGTVHYQTPDHQASDITAGQSQQISGMAGVKYKLGERRALNPARSDEYFDHAGGLLEHASGYGVVRHGLGPDVAKTLRDRGYKLPAETEHRFQNVARFRYHPNHPWARHGGRVHHGSAANGHPGSGWPAKETYHPKPKYPAASERESEAERRRLNEEERGRWDKKKGNGWGQ